MKGLLKRKDGMMVSRGMNGSSLKTRKFHLTTARQGYKKIDSGWVSHRITIAIPAAKPEARLSSAVRRGQIVVVDGCLSHCRTL